MLELFILGGALHEYSWRKGLKSLYPVVCIFMNFILIIYFSYIYAVLISGVKFIPFLVIKWGFFSIFLKILNVYCLLALFLHKKKESSFHFTQRDSDTDVTVKAFQISLFYMTH